MRPVATDLVQQLVVLRAASTAEVGWGAEATAGARRWGTKQDDRQQSSTAQHRRPRQRQLDASFSLLSPPVSVPARRDYVKVSAVADGPARRAASRASCCTQSRTVSVINWPSTVGRIVNFVRPTTVHLITLSVHRCRAKLTTRLDDWHAVAKCYNCRVWDKVSQESSIVLEMEGSLHAKKLDASSRFGRTPAGDRHTDTDRHQATANTAAL